MIKIFLKNRLTHLMRFKVKQRMIVLGMILAVVAITGISITNYLTNEVRQDIVKESDEVLQSASIYLISKINELETADDILAGMPWVATVLESRMLSEILRSNDNLFHYNKEKGTTVSYLLDRNGIVVASSNANGKDSLIGKDYSGSKYFSQAIRGISAVDFAIEPTSMEKGLYGSSSVRDHNNRVIGVAVVKQTLDVMETPLRKYSNIYFVNHCGIILWASTHDLVGKSLWPMEHKLVQDDFTTNLPGNGTSSPVFNSELKNGMETTFNGSMFRVSRKLIGKDGLSVVCLTNMAKLDSYRSGGYFVTVVVLWLFIMGFIILHFHATISKKMDRVYQQAATALLK